MSAGSSRTTGGAQPDQLLLDFGPPPAPTLANFIVGSNAECVSVLAGLRDELARSLPPSHRFTYIWGPRGSGKTHLARAIETDLPRLEEPTAATLLVVDDCDRLDAEAQVGLFHRFNERLARPDAALVAFGEVPPARLALIPELASRLAWGMVFALAPLDDTALKTALGAAALARGVPLTDEVSAWLLRHTRRDMGSLQQVLERLDHLSLKRQRRITLPLLRELLHQGRTGQGSDGSAPIE